MRPRTEKMILWEQRINERIKSGITIEEWCKNNEISIHKYHYWNHHIIENQKSDKETTFTEITSIYSNVGWGLGSSGDLLIACILQK